MPKIILTFVTRQQNGHRSLSANSSLLRSKSNKTPNITVEGLQVYFPEKNEKNFYDDENFFCVVLGSLYKEITTAKECAEMYLKNKTSLYNSITGQFIIIIYDKVGKQLLVFRDQIGILTAYYLIDEGYVWISDKWIPLARVHSNGAESFNWLASLNYKSSYSKPGGTIINGIRQIMPGCFAKFSDSGKASHEGYWNIPEQPGSDSNAADYKDAYKSLLDDAVKIRVAGHNTMNIFLSGGLDSSTVALLASHYTQLNGHSILNPLTFILGDSGKAQQLSERLKMPLNHYVFSNELMPADPSVWVSIIQSTERTDLDIGSVIKYYIYQLIGSKKDNNYQPILTGYGSDQFYGGITRTTLNEEGLAYDDKNYWEEYCYILRKNRLGQLLDKSDSGLINYHGLLNVEYLEYTMNGKTFSNDWIYKLNQERERFTAGTIRTEINLAKTHGNDALFPFMDHRLVELIASMPTHLQGELLFDKNIVRMMFDKSTGKTIFAHVPKTNIRVDNRNNPTHDFYYRVIYDKKNGLATQVMDIIDQLPPVFNNPVLKQQLSGLSKKTDRTFTDWLLPILNSILLFDLVKKDFNGPIENFAPLTISSENYPSAIGSIKKLLALEETRNFNPSDLILSDNVKLLCSEETGLYYLSKNELIIFEIKTSSMWIVNFIKSLMANEDPKHVLGKFKYSAKELQDFINIAIQENILIEKK